MRKLITRFYVWLADYAESLSYDARRNLRLLAYDEPLRESEWNLRRRGTVVRALSQPNQFGVVCDVVCARILQINLAWMPLPRLSWKMTYPQIKQLPADPRLTAIQNAIGAARRRTAETRYMPECLSIPNAWRDHLPTGEPARLIGRVDGLGSLNCVDILFADVEHPTMEFYPPSAKPLTIIQWVPGMDLEGAMH
jgi:hypothetical protein